MADTPVSAMLHSLRRAGTLAGAGLTDAQLLERFVTVRDEAAFEVLVWRHSAMVLGLCRRVLRQEQDAEDAFQAAFLTLSRRAASISRGQAVGSWLFKVAYRIALAARKQSTVRAAHEKRLRSVLATHTPAPLEGPDLQSLLDEEIQCLPEKYRSAVLLCYFEGKTNEAAATEIGCPKGTVVSRLARARDRLRRRLAVRGVEAPTLLLSGASGTWSVMVPRTLLTKTCTAALADACFNPAAGLVSARVITLVQGAMRTMFWTKMKLVAIGMVATVLSLGGMGLAARAFYLPAEVNGPGDEPAAGLVPGAAQAEEQQGRPVGQPAGDDVNLRMHSMNNLKQIILAMHNYHNTYKAFPAPAVYSGDGKALLSWRVELLPYLEQGELYKQFRRNESWDSPHNRALLDRMPAVFALPSKSAGGSSRTSSSAGNASSSTTTASTAGNSTYYQVFVGPGAIFEKRRQRRVADITDGTSNTIMVVEAASAVPWTKPEDLTYDPDQPLPELGGGFKGFFNVAMADGSVHAVPRDFDKAEFRKAVTCNGGEVIDYNRLFGTQPSRVGRVLQELDLSESTREGLQGLRDEVLALKIEVKRLKERVAKLEGGN
ncbi:MAG TPA: sigma-70 family RNA polymerase sigma factor [Gemmataceae bacterium]|nr:sigma-70 family RNA polymerase sigma factor [Gemmataceae bacterium]